MILRIVLGTILILHGLIHLLGFVAYLHLATIETLPYRTDLLSGALEVGEVGARIYGLLWGLAAVGFVVAGVAVFALLPWWRGLTVLVALLSLALTVLGLPYSPFGVVLNVAILAFVLAGGRIGWLP
jgi:hypothetical protein